MKLIIFTTCKPFIGDDAWRQEQAIKSWTQLEGLEKEIIIIGNDTGTKEICEKYNLTHESVFRNLYGMPYLHTMFEMANKYANDDDIMMWTNSDMIYFNEMVDCIKCFKENYKNEKNYLLVGARIDWSNPKILPDLSKEFFFKNINKNKGHNVFITNSESNKHECYLHQPTGIDYVIHSKSTFINNISKQLLIAGTRHDMIMVGVGIQNNFFTCNLTECCQVIHQNHQQKNKDSPHSLSHPNGNAFLENNKKCYGILRSIIDCRYKMIFNSGKLSIIEKK